MTDARTQLALRESEERIRAILEHAADGIMTTDERGIIQSFNPAAARIFGYEASEIIGQNIRLLIPRPYLREHESYRSGSPRPASVISLGREVVGQHKNGQKIPVDLSVSESFTGTKRLFTAIVRDITERKRAQEELTTSRELLRSLAARLQSIREEERTRISREIHDELGQSLTGVKMDLSWLLAKVPTERPDLTDRLHRLSTLVDYTIQTVRKIATELRPGILDNLGLVAAIEWQTSEFQARSGIECKCSAQLADQELDPDICTGLFRIFQETLTNIMRHAKATSVSVVLKKTSGEIFLQVHDNGRGITEPQTAGAKSLGLLGMRERALLLGGEFKITGAPHHGTTVTVKLPVPARRT